MTHAIPSCYGRFVCMDDCMVSCAYWEECMYSLEGEDD